jgi:hypothetical protein
VEAQLMRDLCLEMVGKFPMELPFTIRLSSVGDVDSTDSEQMVCFQNKLLSDLNDAVHFMVEEGFLINCLEADGEKLIYWKLSENGRELKKLGDWKKYERLIQLRQVEMKDPEAFRGLFAFWTRYGITIVVCIAACKTTIDYAVGVGDANPVDTPSPFFVCSWLFLIFIVFWMHTQKLRTGDAKHS